MLLRGADAPQNFESVLLRQMKVQNRGVVVPVADQGLGFVGVLRQIDAVILGAEFPLQKTTECDIAFGDENTHGYSSGRGKLLRGMPTLVNHHVRVKTNPHGSLQSFED